jgi:hypothetical protein
MSHRIFTFALTATLLTGTVSSAFADDTSPTPAPSSDIAAAPAPTTTLSTQREWYGWQTLLVDGATLGAIPLEIGASSSFANTPSASYLLFTSLGGYALGAPIIHAAHGHWKRGAADFGLRAGAVALGSAIGAAAGGAPSSCDGRVAGCLDQGGGGLVAGAAIGAAVASLIDASFLTWDSHPKESGPSSPLTWSPTAGAMRGGGVAGVSGSF